MPGFVTVLDTYHELQGSKKRPGNINDSLYADLITDLIEDQTIDFIFEEATGLGPTTAEDLSAKLVGANRYLDLDPPTQKRQIFGIPPETNKPVMLGTPMSNPPNVGWANWQPIGMHEAREKLWLERMKGQAFNKRSEEHTSELQSRLHLVCRLLLEKKKKSITCLTACSLYIRTGLSRRADFGFHRHTVPVRVSADLQR